MAAALVELSTVPPAALLDRLIAQLETFGSGVEPHDDQTLLLVAVQ